MSLGKVPERMVEPEAIERSTLGNRDNPMSSNYQAPSQREHWNNDNRKQKGGKGRE